MANWEDSGHAQQGDMSHDRRRNINPPGVSPFTDADKAGRKGSDASLNDYVSAVRDHGYGSRQAKNAAKAAINSGGWSPESLGRAAAALDPTGSRRDQRRGSSRGGGRRTSDNILPDSNGGNGGLKGPNSPPVDQ